MPGESATRSGAAQRLFVAIELPEAVRREVARRVEEHRRDLPRARWTHPDALHLTLVFLGDVDDGAVPRLADALAAAFARHPPLTLQLLGAGTFPPPSPRGRPARVAWLGVRVEGGVERLRALHGDAALAAREAVGHQPDRRPYSPHLTVARPKAPWREPQARAFVAAFREPVADPFPVAEGHLMRSDLGAGPGGGSLYTSVARLPLEAAA